LQSETKIILDRRVKQMKHRELAAKGETPNKPGIGS
jgi:hypothetical protein